MADCLAGQAVEGLSRGSTSSVDQTAHDVDFLVARPLAENLVDVGLGRRGTRAGSPDGSRTVAVGREGHVDPAETLELRARYLAPPLRFCCGSKGSVTPSALAMPGISWVRPFAPRWRPRSAWKLDSFDASAASSSGSMPLATAADRISAAYGIFEATASKRARTVCVGAQVVDPGSAQRRRTGQRVRHAGRLATASGRRPVSRNGAGSTAVPPGAIERRSGGAARSCRRSCPRSDLLAAR